jgi:hypothetical protein
MAHAMGFTLALLRSFAFNSGFHLTQSVGLTLPLLCSSLHGSMSGSAQCRSGREELTSFHPQISRGAAGE